MASPSRELPVALRRANAGVLLHLVHRVFHQELELLVPDWGPMAAGMACGILPAAAHSLGAQDEAAIRVALPGETPDRQVSGLQEIHLDRKLTIVALKRILDCQQIKTCLMLRHLISPSSCREYYVLICIDCLPYWASTQRSDLER